RGELQEVSMMAADGSSATIEHYVKKIEDLEIMKYAVEHTKIIPRYDIIEKELRELGGLGVGDIVLQRSPFGKLVHEYLGMETLVYAMADYPEKIEEFLKFQEAYDLEMVKLAAAAPAEIVIISDHSDENLIAPPYYRDYCLPYYKKACALLHQKGKKISSHLDGNFKGYFPYLRETGFDLLDGCTPYPMNNYRPEELAAAMGDKQYAYCGVPCTLFVQDLEEEVILGNARSIINALKGKLILNIGDIMPANGKIDLLLKVGELVADLNSL
ncbi:MAG: uroporphyrinogen decarboxylase family protein, partial [Candidatus Firestonebacteria bacterium]